MGVVDLEKTKIDLKDTSKFAGLVNNSQQTFITSTALKKGFTCLVPKPFGTESLTVLLDQYVRKAK